MENLRINHHTTQILIDHGNINSKLYKLNYPKQTLPLRTAHIVYHCKDQVERAKMDEGIKKLGVRWPCILADLSQRRSFENLSRFTDRVMRKRTAMGTGQ
ncbi:hypothetical protein QLX08_010199 [Tetragonisca angustula]|uniref:Uncharacterized protein n=1 Tax=Tetragonisca angustula TaxID=166442 RepID=A0AAW0ZFT5_9HYME